MIDTPPNGIFFVGLDYFSVRARKTIAGWILNNNCNHNPIGPYAEDDRIFIVCLRFESSRGNRFSIRRFIGGEMPTIAILRHTNNVKSFCRPRLDNTIQPTFYFWWLTKGTSISLKINRMLKWLFETEQLSGWMLQFRLCAVIRMA